MPRTPDQGLRPIPQQNLNRREFLQGMAGVIGSPFITPSEATPASAAPQTPGATLADAFAKEYLAQGGELETDLDMVSTLQAFWGKHYSPDLLKNPSDLEALGSLRESFTEEELRVRGHTFHDNSEGKSMFGDVDFQYKLAITDLILRLGERGVKAEKVFGGYMGAIDVRADEDPNKFYQNFITEKMVLGVGEGGNIQAKRIVSTLSEGVDQLTGDNEFHYTLTSTQKDRLNDLKIMDQFGPSLKTLRERRIINTDRADDLSYEHIVPKTYDNEGNEIKGASNVVKLAKKWPESPHNIAQVHLDYMTRVAGDQAISTSGVFLTEPFFIPVDDGKYALCAVSERGVTSTDGRIDDPEWVTQRTRIGAQYIKAMYGVDKLPEFPSADPIPEAPKPPRYIEEGKNFKFTSKSESPVRVVATNRQALEEVGNYLPSGRRLVTNLVLNEQDANEYLGVSPEGFLDLAIPEARTNTRPIKVGKSWGRDQGIQGSEGILYFYSEEKLKEVGDWDRVKLVAAGYGIAHALGRIRNEEDYPKINAMYKLIMQHTQLISNNSGSIVTNSLSPNHELMSEENIRNFFEFVKSIQLPQAI